jgi:hypothetical protein
MPESFGGVNIYLSRCGFPKSFAGYGFVIGVAKVKNIAKARNYLRIRLLIQPFGNGFM